MSFATRACYGRRSMSNVDEFVLAGFILLIFAYTMFGDW